LACLFLCFSGGFYDVSADEKAQVAEEPTNPSVEAAAGEESEPVKALQQQLADAKAEAQRYMEGWQRERADFANYKRRMERDVKDASANASLNMLVSLLPIIDDFELAMNNIPAELEGNSWLNGVQLVQRKFQKLLDDNSVTVLDPVGQLFDPSRHEAITTDENTEHPSGHVSVTLQKGYVTGEKVLRPARVKVAK
jgi:molecular chaperone GrpE